MGQSESGISGESRGQVGSRARAGFASLPAEHHLAIEDLLLWLGVADQPRPEDVIPRVSGYAAKPVNGAGFKVVENVVRWLGQRWLISTTGRKRGTPISVDGVASAARQRCLVETD